MVTAWYLNRRALTAATTGKDPKQANRSSELAEPMQANTQAICFDMDGVLIQSEVYWNERQREHILPTIAPNEEIPHSKITGKSYKELHADLSEEFDLAVTREELEALFEETGKDLYREDAKLLDGAHELLDDLSEAGVSLALTTSSPWTFIDIVDDRFDLLSHFDAAISADDIDGPGKPAANIYERGADELGVDPTDCWAVEDSIAGSRAALAAGMTTIGFAGSEDAPELPDVHYVASSTAELRTHLFSA